MEIELKDIYYKDKLYNFNYKFVQGKVTAIMGDNPSNSLIASIIMGQVRDFYGNVLVDGLYNYDKHSFYKNIGYVSVCPVNQFVCSIVKDELTMKLKKFNYKLDKVDKVINDVLKMVDLDVEILERKVFSLSDSEILKISLAMSLILNPKVLLLDNVTVYMDYEMKQKFLSLLKKLRDRYNKTIIIISNDIQFLSCIVDNYLIVDKGLVKESGMFKDFVFEQKRLNKYGINMPAKYKFIDIMSKYKKINKKDINSIDDLVEVICCE